MYLSCHESFLLTEVTSPSSHTGEGAISGGCLAAGAGPRCLTPVFPQQPGKGHPRKASEGLGRPVNVVKQSEGTIRYLFGSFYISDVQIT